MARELGPEGIHVAHVVIDGPIDMPWIRENFPDLVKERPADGLLNPDDIAETYFALHQQSAQRLDLRDGSAAVGRAVVAVDSSSTGARDAAAAHFRSA
jgi:hypothetical protein